MLLSGFARLTLSGMVFRLWPAMSKSALARGQISRAMIGTRGIAVGSAQLDPGGNLARAAEASALFIPGTVLMGRLFWRGLT
jgi:hypothetical protein